MPATIATLLPANERRRVTATVKLALQVAQEAMVQAQVDQIFHLARPAQPIFEF